MQELALERQVIGAALSELLVDTFIFETDAGARPRSIQETYLEEVDDSDLYVGIFWKGYGAYTIEEFRHAQTLGMDCLIYEKRKDIEGGRDPELEAFLDGLGNVQSGLTIGRFSTPEELGELVKKNVAQWQAEKIREAGAGPRQSVYQGIPSKPPPDFVGRSKLIELMVRRLQSGNDVAVEGLPGIGKTTLAIALAHHRGIRRHFRDGVLWASLGPDADVSTAVSRWAGALTRAGILNEDISQIPDLSQRAQVLRDAIEPRRMLIVVDDVWDIAAAVILRCGGTGSSHVLTTRDRDIARKFAGSAQVQLLSELDSESSIELMRQLAPEACAANPAAVSALVRAVDGLPLAIRLMGGYLASPDSSMFPEAFPELGTGAVQEMTDANRRLELAQQRLGVLNSQKVTLEDTISLSLTGLSESAQTAFYRLGAFAAKPQQFSREAAEAVTQAGIKSLTSLAARHLLEVDKKWLILHPTIADVARTKLDQDTVARHRDYYLGFARENAENWQEVESAYSQIRWAWHQAPDDATLLAFLATLENFQTRRGLASDTAAWVQRVLPLVEDRVDLKPALARLLMILGNAYDRLGLLPKALDCQSRALALWELLKEPLWQIRTLHDLGKLSAKLGQPDTALDQLKNAVALAQASGDGLGQADSLALIGFVLRNHSRAENALEFLPEALRIYRALANKPGEADTLALLSTVYRDLNQTDLAHEHIRQALAIWDRLGHRSNQAEARIGIATVYDQQGRLEEALASAQDALQMSEETGDRSLVADSLTRLGSICLKCLQPEKALTHYERRLSIEEETGNRRGQASALRDIGWLHFKQGHDDEALTAYRRALDTCIEIGNQAATARTLELVSLVHDRLGQPEQQIACLQQALQIWQALNNRDEQAATLRSLGLNYLGLKQYLSAAEALEQALSLAGRSPTLSGTFEGVSSESQAAATFSKLADAYEALASEEQVAQKTDRADWAGRVAANLGQAIEALTQACRRAANDEDLSNRLQRLERRRENVLRYGTRALERIPVVSPITVEIGGGLILRIQRETPALKGLSGLTDRMAVVPRAVNESMGIRLPEVQVRTNPDVRPNEYRFLLNDVPLVTGTLPEDRRLFAASPEELTAIGVQCEAAVNPQNGNSAAWVLREDWPKAEAAGKELWETQNFLVRHLYSSIQRHLPDFVGHQETMELLDTSLPEAARTMRNNRHELSALVVVLRNLVEEFVPLFPLRGIVETFSRLRASGSARLEILRAVRSLPEIRPRLIGNNDSTSFYRLAPALEEEFARSIQIIDSIPYLAMDPETTQRILKTIRDMVRRHTHSVALLVGNPSIRRFVRRLVELEFPHLFVLSGEELLPGLEARIIGEIEWSQG
jgi:tetratricopeptide (TPR) repeat protein